MDLTPREAALLSGDLARAAAWAGDRRTGRLLAATVRGIIASESPVCARIAAFSPCPGCRRA